MRFILDRFEGNFAVLEREDGTTLPIEKSKLPENLREGDVLYQENGLYFPDPKQTEDRKIAIRNKMKTLRKEGE